MAHKTSEKQLKSNIRWNHSHRRLERIYNYRSKSRNFVKKYATLQDLDELQHLIITRRKQLQNV